MSHVWRGFLPGQARHVADEEILGRFLIQSNYFSIEGRYVRAAAYLPAPDGTTSVFRVIGMDDKTIWALGERRVARPRSRTLYGRAELRAGAVRSLGLSIDPNNVPPRHADIRDWPPSKAERKSLAQQLASGSELVINKARALETQGHEIRQ